MVVVRSMELTQKKTSASFKQLDGVLRTMDPTTGERKSLSHKCTELDKQVPQLMGVSRAILEHVLFCHQEDASWPLMEGAVLKKRFDAIFDSTRYTKAIETLRKKEKAYISQAKDHKATLAGLNSHKHAAKGFRKELDDLQEVMEEIEDTKSELRKEMADTDAQIEKYQGILDQVDSLEEEIKNRDEQLCRQEAVVEKQREMLEEDLTKTNSIADLQYKLRDFDRTMSSQSAELHDLEDQQTRLLRDIEKLRQQEIKLSNDLTKHTIAKEEQEKRLRKRYTLMEEIAQTHSLDLELSQTQADQSFAASMTASMISHQPGLSQESLISITAEDMRGFFEALEKKEEEQRSKLEAHKRRSKAVDDEMQKVIQDLNGKKEVIKNGECLSYSVPWLSGTASALTLFEQIYRASGGRGTNCKPSRPSYLEKFLLTRVSARAT